MPLTLRELESHLWRCANILRGSAVDRTDWKGYILPLLFFKRLSDVWDEDYQAAFNESGDETYAADHANDRFNLPQGTHWRDIRETPANVGSALQKAMRKIERANPMDAASLFRKRRAQNFLDPKHGKQIVKWFRAFKDIKDRARIVTRDEIKAEDWTLNISRYVLPPIGEDTPPLPEAVAMFKAALSEARPAEDHLRAVLNKGGWLA